MHIKFPLQVEIFLLYWLCEVSNFAMLQLTFPRVWCICFQRTYKYNKTHIVPDKNTRRKYAQWWPKQDKYEIIIHFRSILQHKSVQVVKLVWDV